MLEKTQQFKKSVLSGDSTKAALMLTVFLVVMMAESAFGQGSNQFVTKILAQEWLKNLITAGFALATALEIASKWKPLFEGTDVLKNLAVIAAYIFLTVFWADMLKIIIGFGGN